MLSFIGEILHVVLPLPIPASIYGIILLFCCLEFKIIPVSAVKETSVFLIEIMPVMFIPAGVGLMASWGTLKPVLVPVSIITVAVLVIVMAVTGRISQRLIRRERRKNC